MQVPELPSNFWQGGVYGTGTGARRNRKTRRVLFMRIPPLMLWFGRVGEGIGMVWFSKAGYFKLRQTAGETVRLH
jgi:hypothetical protein